MQTTSLLVIGAGPYGLSVAANAQAHGIDTVVLGRPMEFWRAHMPEGMFLRSGPDWHLDAAGVHTLDAYLKERRIPRAEIDPMPLAVFVEYADWFRARKGLEVRDCMVAELTKRDGRFEAVLDSGERIRAQWVVAAPGVRHFVNLPPWAGQVKQGRGVHTCELVRFKDLAGARVLIVGGRQSAYEWAALIAEAGAERIDIVHRHPVPAFERVSWKFADGYIEATLRTRGWWRKLPREQRNAIEKRFWEVGRLTLEWWLEPRLAQDTIHLWPGTEVVGAGAGQRDGADVTIALSNGQRLTVDQVVFATGYRADLARVPYLHALLGRMDTAEGFPVLDESFGSSVKGLYIAGFAATHDFGPFFGFVKGSPAAATIIVDDLLSRHGSNERSRSASFVKKVPAWQSPNLRKGATVGSARNGSSHMEVADVSGWTKLADRGLGYLGLLLIGTLSWLADHIGPVQAHGSVPGRGPKPQAVADRIDARARSATLGGRRVA
jgi:FAD-dependent urate hydroxylase